MQVLYLPTNRTYLAWFADDFLVTVIKKHAEYPRVKKKLTKTKNNFVKGVNKADPTPLLNWPPNLPWDSLFHPSTVSVSEKTQIVTMLRHLESLQKPQCPNGV